MTLNYQVVGGPFDGGDTADPPSVSVLQPMVSGPSPDWLVTLNASQTNGPAFGADDLEFLWTDPYGGTSSERVYAFAVTPGDLGDDTSINVGLAVTDPLGQKTTVTIPVRFDR